MERPVGYQYLIEIYGLTVPPLYQPGRVDRVRTITREETDWRTVPVVYPEAMWPGEGLMPHMQFALQREGINPAVLWALGTRVDIPAHLMAAIRQGVRADHRRLGFLHEWLTGESTPLPMDGKVRYLDVANPRLQYTLGQGRRSPTYRVRNNLLGTSAFCPQVYKTPALQRGVAGDPVVATDPWRNCPPELRSRMERYLYHHETQSSWQIEQEALDTQRTYRFVELLQQAHRKDFLTPAGVKKLHDTILGTRTPFPQAPWRKKQVWVGFMNPQWQETVVLLGAPPGNIPSLMQGLMDTHQRLATDARVPALIHAACIGFPFVYIHPFGDGNGRAHRFLLHNILARRQYPAPDTLLPFSAWWLSHRQEYLDSMTPACQAILQLAELHWQADQRLVVANDIAPWFRYMDLTREALRLYRFAEATVSEELEPGIDFLVRFEEARQQLEARVEWPCRHLSLFIRLCHQNGGRLSGRKRRLAEFRSLSADHLRELEQCVQRAFNLSPEPSGEEDSETPGETDTGGLPFAG